MLILKSGRKNITGRLFAVLLISGFFSMTFGVSVAEKSRALLLVNKEYLINLHTAIQNFGTDDQKNQYAEVKDDFTNSMRFYLIKKYSDAYKTGLAGQEKLEKLYESMSIAYIERTSRILQEITE